MSVFEFLQDAAPPIAAARSPYFLQGQHARSGEAFAGSFTNLKTTVTRASELIRAGYVIEIWSRTSLESPPLDKHACRADVAG